MIAATARRVSLAELPGRAEAEALLEQAAPRWCAVAIAVEQYAQITDHFGPSAADRALETVVPLLPAARLYRWTGGSLLALVESPAAAARLIASLPERCLSAGVTFSLRAQAFPAEDRPLMARRIDRWIALC